MLAGPVDAKILAGLVNANVRPLPIVIMGQSGCYLM